MESGKLLNIPTTSFFFHINPSQPWAYFLAFVGTTA